jgi:NAD(P)-dependent dehydrogenase (short-subunit alcohol dehydrogenase family)
VSRPSTGRSSERTVLITGASKGIGAATALYLDRRGLRVFAGVRREEDGVRLRAQASDRLIPIMLDVTDTAAIEQARNVVQDAVEDGLAGLVNNAGIVVPCPIEVLPLEDFRTQLEVNVMGVLGVTQAFLPLIRRARGRIVNVSSINGRVAVPFNTAYATSKFALEALSDGLRNELKRWGIHVSVVQPGAITTPIWESSIERAKRIAVGLPSEARELYSRALTKLERHSGDPPRHALPPERVARVIHHALTARRPKTRYLVGWDARVGALLKAVLPDRMMDFLLTNARRRRR